MSSPEIKAVFFDMDGTVVDVPYDWPEIKEKLETQGVPILTYLSGLEEPERSSKWGILSRYEDKATARARLKGGVKDLLGYLAQKRIKTALVTNNSGRNTKLILDRFGLRFDFVITRESGLWKPSGAPFAAALDKFCLSPDESCVVGDSFIDIRAAKEAGIRRIFILSEDPDRFASAAVDLLPGISALRNRLLELLGEPKGLFPRSQGGVS